MRIHIHFGVLALLIALSFIHTQADIRAVSLVGQSNPSSYESIKDLILSYKLVEPSLAVSMTVSTTHDSIAAMAERRVDFGIAIQGWSDAVAATAPDLYMLPLFLTGFVPVYRLDALGANAPAVIFTREILVGIFTASIIRWNHPLIVDANPLLTMPAQNITVLTERGLNARNWIIKNALYQFNETAMNQSSMAISSTPDYPYSKYANSQIVESSVTSLVTSVIAADGTFALAYQSVASTLLVSIGSMINKAGKVVTFTEDSVTFAAIEKGIVQPRTRTTSHVLTDPSSESAWPLTFFSYVLIDTKSSMSSCKARQFLVEFLLYVYSDPIAESIMRSRDMVAVPEMLLKQSGAIDLLSEHVLCRGAAALPVQLASQRVMAVSESFMFTAKMFSSVYSDGEGSAKFIPQISSDTVMINQLVNSEVDVIIVTPNYVPTYLWQELVDTDEYLVLPMLGVAPTIFFNPQITSTVNLKNVHQDFNLDISAAVGVLSGCITDYNDPALVKLNPWLEPLLGNMSAPMYKVMGCGGTIEQAPLANFFSSFLRSLATVPGAITQAMLPCLMAAIQKAALLEKCEVAPGSRDVYTKHELSAPLLASGMIGGSAYIVADADDQKIYPKFSKAVMGKGQLNSPSITSILACADTFNPKTLTFDLPNSKNPDCYMASQEIVGVVRKRYYSTATNASSCTRGLDALRFMRWFFTDPAVDVLTTPFNMAQLGSFPAVRAKYMEHLNAVLCDDETLLITLPTIWDLDVNIFRLGIACAVMGIMFTLFLIGCVIHHASHPLMRAASPTFVMMSMFGVLLLFGAVIALVSPVTNASCYALTWMVVFGFLFAFIPLIAKIYRIHRIFGGRRLSVVKISNRKLLAFVILYLFAGLVFMTVWQALSPLQALTASEMSGTPSRETHYTQCGVQDEGALFLVIGGVGFLLLILGGALIAFRIRRVTGKFNESSQVALAIYNVLFVGGVLAAVLVVIGAQGDVMTGLLLFGLVWIAAFTGGILVIPKLLHINAQQNDAPDGPSVNHSSSGGFSFISLDGISTLPMIGSYVAALRKHMDAAEQKLMSMKKAHGGVPTATTMHTRIIKPASSITRSTT